LDHHRCERTLKPAIRQRQNALYYQTETGARGGDTFTSLIHTAELNDVDRSTTSVALHDDDPAA